MHKGFLKWGAVFGMLSVMLGAFAAHGLKQRIGVTELQVFEEPGLRFPGLKGISLCGSNEDYQAGNDD